MKTIRMILLFLIFAATTVSAQETLTINQKVDRDLKKFQTALQLNDEQTTAFKGLILEKLNTIEAINSNNALTDDQKKIKRNQTHGKFQGKLKGLLTSTQKELLAKMKQENKQKEKSE
ncbi:MAG: hypothetical protein PHV20_05500 [Bacteroidales bacterium]|nr:hypothetical protein [Bacteroidales bacterium]